MLQTRRVLFSLLACLALSSPALAVKDPYKAKDVLQRVAADTGLDASEFQSSRTGYYMVVDPKTAVPVHGTYSAQSHICLIIETKSAYGLFEYDFEALKWKAALLATPSSVRGVKLVESGKRVILRQIQIELPTDLILAVNYDGGWIGDNKFPLEVIGRLTAMGFATVEGFHLVGPTINTTIRL